MTSLFSNYHLWFLFYLADHGCERASKVDRSCSARNMRSEKPVAKSLPKKICKRRPCSRSISSRSSCDSAPIEIDEKMIANEVTSHDHEKKPVSGLFFSNLFSVFFFFLTLLCHLNMVLFSVVSVVCLLFFVFFFVTVIEDPNPPVASNLDDPEDHVCSDDISGRVSVCQTELDERTRRSNDVADDAGWDSLPPDSNSEQSSDYEWVD